MENHVMKSDNFSSELGEMESEIYINQGIKIEEEEEEISPLRTHDLSAAADSATASTYQQIKMDLFIDPRKLIEAVQLRPAIWDMTNKDYLDRDKRRQSWDEIVNIFAMETGSQEDMKTIGDVLQKKWKNIRDRYSREMYASKRKSGKRTRYMFAQQMAFLKDTIKHRQTTSTMDNSQSGAFVADNKEVSSPRNRPAIREIRKNEDSSNLEQFSKKKRLDPVGPKLKILNEHTLHPESTDRTVNDDDLHFLLSLLPSMKSIPEHFKLDTRMEMMQCVNKFLTLHIPQHQNTLPQHEQPLHQVTPLYANQQNHSRVHPSRPLSTPVSSPNDSVSSYLSNFSAEEDSQADTSFFT